MFRPRPKTRNPVPAPAHVFSAKNYGVLTHDLWVLIAYYLHCQDIIALSKTSKDMHTVMMHDLQIWKPIFEKNYAFAPQVADVALAEYGNHYQVVVAIESMKPKSFLVTHGFQKCRFGFALLNGALLDDDDKKWQFVHDSHVYPSRSDAAVYIRSIGQPQQPYVVFGTNVTTKKLNEWIKHKNHSAIKEHVVAVEVLNDECVLVDSERVKYMKEWGVFSRCKLQTEPEQVIREKALALLPKQS